MGELLFENAWHVISAAIAFVAGALVVVGVSKVISLGRQRALVLYLWHTTAAFAYVLYVGRFGGDAIFYFEEARKGGLQIGLGVDAISTFASIFVDTLGMSFLGVSLVFNIFGSVGLIFLDRAIKSTLIDPSRFTRLLASAFPFLPSLSFWTSGLGKDPVVFLGVSMALWCSVDIRRRSTLFFLATALVLAARPHMAPLMVLAMCAAVLATSVLTWRQRTGVLIVALAAVILVSPVVLERLGIGTILNVDEVEEFVLERQGLNLGGGSSIDIQSMTMGERALSYLFRPWPTEARGALDLFASIENLFLLLLLLAAALAFLVHRRRYVWVRSNLYPLVFSLAAWVALSQTTANLGIAARQKWMFVPVLVLMAFHLLSDPRRRRIRVKGG